MAGLPGKNGTDGFDGRNGLPGGILLKIIKKMSNFLQKIYFWFKENADMFSFGGEPGERGFDGRR